MTHAVMDRPASRVFELAEDHPVACPFRRSGTERGQRPKVRGSAGQRYCRAVRALLTNRRWGDRALRARAWFELWTEIGCSEWGSRHLPSENWNQTT